MNIHFRITVDAPRRGIVRLVAFIGLPMAMVMAAALVARAYDTTWIAPNQPLSSARLKENLDEVQARLVALENAEPDCPRGYTRDVTVTNITVCKKGADEMVKVGNGLSAFWVDRYEASVWSSADGTGTQYGAASDDYPATFPDNGQRVPGFVDLYAVSKAGALPSAYLTWFQAQQACRASGKRLPTDEEWLAAASGTNDPGESNGAGGACLTTAAGPRATGFGAACVSAWGAQDMIGNLWEWTAQWYATAGNGAEYVNQGTQTWPASYSSDGTWNVQTWLDIGGRVSATGIPAAAFRGGSWPNGKQAGVFALQLNIAPSGWDLAGGFRCAVR